MFVDIILIAIFRFFRREFRIRQAQNWPRTTAIPEDWTCVDPDSEYRNGWSSLQVQAVLRYEVSGQAFSALLKSCGMNTQSAWRYVEEAPKPAELVLRYHSRDLSRYRILNEDNRNTLGFETAIY